jgi:hypothetical protein
MRNVMVRILCVGALALWTSAAVAQPVATNTVDAAGTAAETAKPAKAAKAVKKEAKAKGMPFKGTVASFDKSTKVIVLSGEKHQAIQIASTTKITRNGSPATSDEITVGNQVKGYKTEVSTNWVAQSLAIIVKTTDKDSDKKTEDKKP